MVNVSLAFQKLSSRGQPGASAVNLNTLPAIYRPKPMLLTNTFALPSAAIAAVLLVFLLILMQSASADITSMRDQLKTTDQQLQQKVLQRNVLTRNIANVQKKITEAEASRNSLTAALSTLEEQTIGITRALEVATESLSSNISASVNYADNILTISGRAPAGRLVLSYFGRLDSSGRFGEVTIKNMSSIEGAGADFTLIGNLEKQGNGTSSTRVAVDNLPSTITPTGVSSDKGTLTISGRSPDENIVFSYVRRLETSGEFREIIIASMARNKDGGTDFSLVLKTGE